MPTNNMATGKFPGNWFYYVTQSNVLEPNDDGVVNLIEMIKACDYEKDAEHLYQILDESINHLTHQQLPKDKITNIVNSLYQSRNIVNSRVLELNSQIKALKKKLAMQNYLYDALTKQIIDLFTSQETKSATLPDGTDVKLRQNPGKLVADREPTAEEYQRYGNTFISAGYSWNLKEIKAALMDGEIDHTWVEKHGFEFIRDLSLTIKQLQSE